MCVLPIKHDLQNEAPSHHKKCFSRDFLDSPPLVGLSISTHSSMMLSNEKSFPERKPRDRKADNNKSLFIFPFYKGTHFWSSSLSTQRLSLLRVWLECLTSFVSYISESFTEAVFLCVDENAHGWGRGDGKKGTQSVSWVVKGLKIINWVLENVI